MKVAIIPGNGAGDVFHANWYGWAHKQINKLENVECDLRNMPDPITAREAIWIPFMHDEMGCDENTIIIGHSSGAEAAMRFAERYKVFGIILVSGGSSLQLLQFVFYATIMQFHVKKIKTSDVFTNQVNANEEMLNI
jgi:predicted alpha/beta hydrolase family esterase